MCYSAMVQQNAKKLARMFGAKVDTNMYYDLFLRRLNGEKLYLNKAMESQFTHGDQSEEESKIRDSIFEWHKQQIPLIEEELFKQSARLKTAEKTLEAKITKKAENDRRISQNKIVKLKRDLESHRSTEVTSEVEDRIYPLHYMSMLCLNEVGEKVIRPVRYLMRPNDKDENFDVQFNGCYNARFDTLESVRWWKDSMTTRRGIILVKQFYENVQLEHYLKNNSLPEEKRDSKNLVLCFKPIDTEYMYIPTLWDKWEKNGDTLYSAALITDAPAPEIKAAGHDRTPIFLCEAAVKEWLSGDKSVAALRETLLKKETPYYGHRVLMAG